MCGTVGGGLGLGWGGRIPGVVCGILGFGLGCGQGHGLGFGVRVTGSAGEEVVRCNEVLPSAGEMGFEGMGFMGTYVHGMGATRG